MLTLRVAMAGAFKAQNFVLAASFAKRLVQGADSSTDPATLAQAIYVYVYVYVYDIYIYRYI